MAKLILMTFPRALFVYFTEVLVDTLDDKVGGSYLVTPVQYLNTAQVVSSMYEVIIR